MKYAQLDAGVVVLVFTPQAGFTIEESFTPEYAALFEPCPDEVEVGWIKNGTGTFLPPLTLTAVNVSDSFQFVEYGATVVFNCEYSCDDVTATVTYQWSDPDGSPITGATSSSYTIPNALTLSQGLYTCAVSASNPDGQIGSVDGSFELIVVEPAATFNLTRSSTNIASGFITAFRGFNVSDCSLYLVESATTITYDPLTNGFETTGGELGSGEKTFEIFINGAFVRSFTLPSGDGTYSFHL
jgi:hypothetical protein